MPQGSFLLIFFLFKTNIQIFPNKARFLLLLIWKCRRRPTKSSACSWQNGTGCQEREEKVTSLVIILMLSQFYTNWGFSLILTAFPFAGVANVLLLVAGREAREVFATGGANSPAGHPIKITTGTMFVKWCKWPGSRNWPPLLEVERRSQLRLLLAMTSITNSLSPRWVLLLLLLFCQDWSWQWLPLRLWW